MPQPDRIDEDDLAAAAAVCRLAGAVDLFAWLEVVDPLHGVAALRVRRRELQAQQGNPKHAAMAKLVITAFRRLERVLEQPEAYGRALKRSRAREQLPLLDMGVDGVLADGTVTEEELQFLMVTAERLGIDGETVRHRLRERARVSGVNLGLPPVPRGVPGPEHPWLGSGWWTDGLSRWLHGALPPMRQLVEPRGGRGHTALALAPLRRELSVLCFGSRQEAAQAERAFEQADLLRAVALPAPADALPLEDGSVDAVGFVLRPPEPSERAEAMRVLAPGGLLWFLGVGAPTVVWRGPQPEVDAALQALVAPERMPAAQRIDVFVHTTPFIGSPGALVGELGRRIDRSGGLPGALQQARTVVRALGSQASGEGWIAVPLVLRTWRSQPD